MGLVKLIRVYRRKAYNSAKMLGDVQAILQGRLVHRGAQRILGKASRKAMNKVIPKPLRKKR